ncbi:peptidoglycan D,D-transpeptidase FtsI family protein, partial [Candidatus Solirubrobacter pratensis]|uniref:peptidoglycan D,D-transpeptidase FtsI family protein n=1 Tax=Candidatus Solirubrobacter pratensis TaxID=1298857 RepID=UPI000414ACF3
MGLIERRIGLLFAVFLGLLAIGATKAAWLGVVRAGTLQRAATTQQEADVVVPARRGSITDDHGIELAVSEPAVDVAATPYLIKNAPAVAAELAPLLARPEDELLRQLARRDTGFAYLARRVPAAKADKAKKLGIEGLEFIPEYRRTYPLDWTASQLLGSVGTDGDGLNGLEYSLNSKLKGADGERRMVKDALGTPLEMRDTTPVKRGETVRLTLDKRLQDRAEEVLADVGKTWQPKGATAIVMDPDSGAILALANWPRVDANAPGDAPDYARGNRAISATYEPGSTFKAFTVAAALEDGKVTPDTTFDIPPVLQFSDREIHDAEDHGYETLTTSDILKQSSNIGAVLIARRVQTKPFDAWIHRFGFGKRTGVDLPGEERGIVTPLDQYSGSTMGNLPIGQGIAVTPMQMAAGYSAIANGGILRAPHIVDAVGGKKRPLPKGRRVISEATAASVRSMLEGVLGPGGTASGAAIKGYQLAGKTGTAQKPDPQGGYSDTAYVASFVGFAPAKHPKLLAAVMVDEPKGEIYGGQVAAPAWKDIMNFALQYLKISP